MAEEIIDIVNENNNLIGKVEKKSIAHKIGLWHRAVHIWIYNSNGELLIQKRAKIKNYFPSIWDLSVGGHIGAGEEPMDSAIREIKEEVGIDTNKENLNFLFIKKEENPNSGIINKEFLYVYLMEYNGDISKLKLQEEEVEKIRFIKLDDLKKDLIKNSKNFIPHQEYWFEMIKLLKNKK